MSNFYSCDSERIDVYESSGESCMDALKSMYDGLMAIQDETMRPMVVSTIIMSLTEDDRYSVTAYTFGELQ